MYLFTGIFSLHMFLTSAVVKRLVSLQLKLNDRHYCQRQKSWIPCHGHALFGKLLVLNVSDHLSCILSVVTFFLWCLNWFGCVAGVYWLFWPDCVIVCGFVHFKVMINYMKGTTCTDCWTIYTQVIRRVTVCCGSPECVLPSVSQVNCISTKQSMLVCVLERNDEDQRSKNKVCDTARKRKRYKNKWAWDDIID